MSSTQSSVRVDITIGGVHVGIADKWSGGEKTADVNTYIRSTGEMLLGGPCTRGDGKATYLFDENMYGIYAKLDAMVGRGDKSAVIGITPLADDGTPWAGANIKVKGVLKTLPPPPSDWTSNNAAEIELDFAMQAELA